MSESITLNGRVLHFLLAQRLVGYLIVCGLIGTVSQNFISASSHWYCGIVDFALKGHVSVNATFTATNKLCWVMCNAYPSCVSVNFARQTRHCEFNNATHYDYPDNLRKQPGWIHTHMCDEAAGCTTPQIGQPVADLRTKELYFSTLPSDPYRYVFILGPIHMPFRLDFKVKMEKDAHVAFAQEEAEESIFVEIAIGIHANKKAVVRGGKGHGAVGAKYYTETGLLKADEFRPFWIEYKEGIVTIGKGGEEEGFLEWDVVANHGNLTSEVHIGIASWKRVPGNWVFYHNGSN